MIHIGRCTACLGLLLVELQHSTSKTASLRVGDRQLTGALLCLLMLLLIAAALLCHMKTGNNRSPPYRRHIAL